jgi:hypothetical protein
MKFADSNVVAGKDSVYVGFASDELSYEHSATFFGIGFLGVLP